MELIKDHIDDDIEYYYEDNDLLFFYSVPGLYFSEEKYGVDVQKSDQDDIVIENYM